jgi:hypothetical protein
MKPATLAPEMGMAVRLRAKVLFNLRRLALPLPEQHAASACQ